MNRFLSDLVGWLFWLLRLHFSLYQAVGEGRGGGRSGGAKVLGKLPVLGSPTNLDNSRARAYCVCSWRLIGHFFSRLSLSFFSPSLGDGPMKTEILSQRAVKPKTTNQLYLPERKET